MLSSSLNAPNRKPTTPNPVASWKKLSAKSSASSSKSSEDAPTRIVKLLSINMCGFNARKENLIFDPSLSFDLCFVQETLLSSELSIRDLSSRWPGPSFWSPAFGRQGGLLF